MAERGIRRSDVLDVLLSGEAIEGYAHDRPFPSWLFLGWKGTRPIHVVASYDATGGSVFIITVYQPDPEYFEPDFRTRRQG
jgi:hypothetical protein